MLLTGSMRRRKEARQKRRNILLRRQEPWLRQVVSRYSPSDYTLSADKGAVKYGYISFQLTSNGRNSLGNRDEDTNCNPLPAWITTFHAVSCRMQQRFINRSYS